MDSREQKFGVIYKLSLLGDSKVGKTSIITRYIILKAPPRHPIGIGVTPPPKKHIRLDSGILAQLEIRNTSGVTRYPAGVAACCRGVVGALLVYDISDRESFSNLDKWLILLREKAEPDGVVLVVGNKLDLAQKNPGKRMISSEEGKLFAESRGCLWMELSSLDYAQVDSAFHLLAHQIHSHNKYPQETTIESGRCPIC